MRMKTVKGRLSGSDVDDPSWENPLNHDDDEDHDDQGEGDVFEDRRGKMPRTTSPVSLQSTLWQGLLFQV